ncbi:fungal-specific transcription factor domain-containing protein [Mariannaea sp. PMI_226]|nr:fungal-specific transcription factor domain-containing protein [Mariannaea sp. PMI_226]
MPLGSRTTQSWGVSLPLPSFQHPPRPQNARPDNFLDLMSQLGNTRSPSNITADSRSTQASTYTPSPVSLSGEEKHVATEDSFVLAGQQSPQPAPRKRRRITRACDDCRRKKIKCDGGRPCASCADFTSECTYEKPSVREGGAKSKEVEALEKKLRRAESLLRKFIPDLDLENDFPPALAHLRLPSSAAVDVDSNGEASEAAPMVEAGGDAISDRARFIQLVQRTGQLDLTDSDEYVFHGLSSGAAFLSRISQQFPALVRYDPRTPFLPQPHRPFLASPMDGLPVYSANPWWQANYDFMKLPPRDLASSLCEYSFNCASCILQVIHAPSFWKMFDKLYEERPQEYTHEERRFVGLLFSIIALGSMYDVDENDPTNPDHYAVAMDRGRLPTFPYVLTDTQMKLRHKYYISARLHLQDITECGDMTTLQALVFMIQFLQATGNLSGCHTMIGIALHSALRMGLHRHLPHTSMTPIKDETRRRVFHTIRQMDIYLSTTLGLPLMLQDKDIDQPWPTEVDDENITEDTILRPPPGTPSFLEAFNAHTKLMRILATVVEHLYPPKGTEGPTDITYMISCARIREIEQQLHDWHERLPPTWRPGPEEDTQIIRVKTLLRFAYGHVQLMLYRPFLQLYSSQASDSEITDERHLALARTGINVCRNIIHIGVEIRRQAVLIGPYWFITYTQFFAVLSIVLYVLHNPDKSGASELISDAKLGRDCISGLTQKSLAADRVTAALNSLFDQLPSQFQSTSSPSFDGDLSPIPSKNNAKPRSQDPVARRAAQLSISRPHSPWHQKSRASPDIQSSNPQRGPTQQPVPISSHGLSCESTNVMDFPMEDPFAYPIIPEVSPAVPMSSNGLGRESADVMEFPMEDPFAYPIMPGVSLTDNSFTTLREDTMQLHVYRMHTDMESQLMYFQDLTQPSTSQREPAPVSASERPVENKLRDRKT